MDKNGRYDQQDRWNHSRPNHGMPVCLDCQDSVDQRGEQLGNIDHDRIDRNQSATLRGWRHLTKIYRDHTGGRPHCKAYDHPGEGKEGDVGCQSTH